MDVRSRVVGTLALPLKTAALLADGEVGYNNVTGAFYYRDGVLLRDRILATFEGQVAKSVQVGSQGLTFDPTGLGLTFPADGSGLTFNVPLAAGYSSTSDGRGASTWSLINRFGTFAARPSTAPIGTTYFCSDLIFDSAGAGLTFPASGGLTFGATDGDTYLSDGTSWTRTVKGAANL